MQRQCGLPDSGRLPPVPPEQRSAPQRLSEASLLNSHSSSEAISDHRSSAVSAAAELKSLRGDVRAARDDLLTALALQEVREQYMQEVQGLLDAVHSEALWTRKEVQGVRDEIMWSMRAMLAGSGDLPVDVPAHCFSGDAAVAASDGGEGLAFPVGNDFPEFLDSLQNFPVWSRQAWPKAPSTASPTPAVCDDGRSTPSNTPTFVKRQAAGMGPSFPSLEAEAPKAWLEPKGDDDGGALSAAASDLSEGRPSAVGMGEEFEKFKVLQIQPNFWDEDAEEARRVKQQDLVLTKTLQEVLPDSPIVRGPLGVIRWFVELEEPDRFGFFAFLVTHRYFERLCLGVIILNSVFAAYVVDWEVAHLNESPTQFIRVTEFLLMTFYLTELCLKVAVHRHFFWCNDEWRFNCFDTFLVFVSLYDLLTMFQVLRGNKSDDGAGTNLMFLRLCRLLKLTKVIRLLRVLHFFRELRLMLVSIHRSFLSLFWVLVLLCFLLYVSSLIFVQGVTIYRQQHEDELTEEEKIWLSQELGSMSRAALSLYKVTTGGDDWSIYYRTAQRCGSFYGFLFIFYIAFFTFAVMNILTGMIVENVVKQSEDDDDTLMFTYRQEHKLAVGDAQRIFDKLDTDGDGTIGLAEFQEGIRSDVVRALMQTIDLEVKDAEWFFKVLLSISDTNSVDIGHFVQACLSLKGSATSMDLQCLSYETRQIGKNVQAIINSMASSSPASAAAPEGQQQQQRSRSTTSVTCCV